MITRTLPLVIEVLYQVIALDLSTEGNYVAADQIEGEGDLGSRWATYVREVFYVVEALAVQEDH